MQLLPRVVVPVLGAAVVGLACAAGVTGCSTLQKALGQQQAIVTFKNGTPSSMILQIRSACGNLPNVTPSPLPSGGPQSLARVGEDVYNVTGASTADEARLQMCLAKYPSVQGLGFQDSTDNGS